MADSTDEIIPDGWEKRISRSTSNIAQWNNQYNLHSDILDKCCCSFIFLHVLLELPYYLNVYTKESQWELPTEAAKENDSSKDPSQVQCAHLLVKHKNSRRPSSWREENITRSKSEARDIIDGYLDKVGF